VAFSGTETVTDSEFGSPRSNALCGMSQALRVLKRMPPLMIVVKRLVILITLPPNGFKKRVSKSIDRVNLIKRKTILAYFDIRQGKVPIVAPKGFLLF
jgi:hypothetical protein